FTTSTIYTLIITPNTTYTNIPVKRIKITKTSKIVDPGVLFAFIDNPLVIQFFKCLWPSFKLSNRRKLAGDLLNDIYDEVKLQTDEQIFKAKTLCMVFD
ncbi:18039_t:CDS:2, partial [Rhizophagus irregularis]